MMNIQTAIQKAILAASKNDLDSARLILMKILKRKPELVEAWLLLADVAENPKHTRQCLERVLIIDPGNRVALNGLAQLETSSEGLFHRSESQNIGKPKSSPKADPLDQDSTVSTPSTKLVKKTTPEKRTQKSSLSLPKKVGNYERKSFPWVSITFFVIAVIAILIYIYFLVW